MRRLFEVAVKFAIGGGVGVAVGYLAGLVANALGAPYFAASAFGYAVGFWANLATQIKTGVIKLDTK